jgi:hypothetical protein
MNAAVVRNGWRRLVAGFIGAGLAWGLVGCQSEGTAGSAGAAVQHPLLENFPLPGGYQMVSDRSVARASGSLRMAKCEFEGDMTAESTVEFYERMLPTAGFRLLDRRFENKEYVLRYQSATEECSVRVRRGRSKTTLVIDLGPLSQTTESATPAAKPR